MEYTNDILINLKLLLILVIYFLKHPLVIGICKSFFNSNGVGYNIGYVFEVIGYNISGADFLTSGIVSKQLC